MFTEELRSFKREVFHRVLNFSGRPEDRSQYALLMIITVAMDLEAVSAASRAVQLAGRLSQSTVLQ